MSKPLMTVGDRLTYINDHRNLVRGGIDPDAADRIISNPHGVIVNVTRTCLYSVMFDAEIREWCILGEDCAPETPKNQLKLEVEL